ncbi:MAG: 30S ribosomal protein S17 [Planctomycetota bacterium]|nr:30S ribosomal protein S17 [Planctomycetota bacterium]
MSAETSAAAAPLLRRRPRRMASGVVASARMAKTIKVVAVREFKHPKYEKRIRRRTVYMAHDEKGEAKVGDTVLLRQTRRLSKTKCWMLVKVLKRANDAEAAATKTAEVGR